MLEKMKKSLILALLFAASTASVAMAKGKSCPLKGYKLVWSDEFKGSTLDESKWTWQKSRAG